MLFKLPAQVFVHQLSSNLYWTIDNVCFSFFLAFEGVVWQGFCKIQPIQELTITDHFIRSTCRLPLTHAIIQSTTAAALNHTFTGQELQFILNIRTGKKCDFTVTWAMTWLLVLLNIPETVDLQRFSHPHTSTEWCEVQKTVLMA